MPVSAEKKNCRSNCLVIAVPGADILVTQVSGADTSVTHGFEANLSSDHKSCRVII